METATKPLSNHIGRKISRVRELRGMKQEALALEIGVSQQTISEIERSETVKDETLEKVAKALGVSVEGIKNFNEEAVLNIISNTFTSNDTSTLNAINFQPNFNPIEKIVQLYDEKIALLERLLQSEREKVELLKNSKGE
ncbi:helix-turn-helix transcriptional regulator [Daejeonella sp. JGW-45]|uniref:helix-turn-helix domain-containing protein n=1 Tax=Daejeonella sp. JGW-45 TaxID=3034148 RepID=UPI0023ED0022|nr:helix-turn-helix transcriptional regulator [Daejeonella sp. JGW-45]